VLALDGGRPCWRWPPTRPGCTCAAWAAAKAPSRRPPTVACACATASPARSRDPGPGAHPGEHLSSAGEASLSPRRHRPP
jgi:hypothetical protein